MRDLKVALVLSIGVVGLLRFDQSAVATAQPRQAGGAGLTVFVDPEFRGASASFRDDVSNMQSVGLNDRISSLRVAPGEVWEVCENANYSGRCQVFSGSESDLRRNEWNDVISSARRVRGGRGDSRGGGRGPNPLPGQPGRSLELFSRRGFSGERRTFNDEVSNLQSVGFNDEAMSLRIGRAGSWEVCADANYQNCVVVNASVSDLARLGMNRRISSIRPLTQGRGRDRY
jgi:hypothetical protein